MSQRKKKLFFKKILDRSQIVYLFTLKNIHIKKKKIYITSVLTPKVYLNQSTVHNVEL